MSISCCNPQRVWMCCMRSNSAWAWWRHQMETFSALLALCAGNSPVIGEFPSQRPVTWSFYVFSHLCLNKRLRKQSWDWWFETPPCSLWHHCNAQCTLAGEFDDRVNVQFRVPKLILIKKVPYFKKNFTYLVSLLFRKEIGLMIFNGSPCYVCILQSFCWWNPQHDCSHEPINDIVVIASQHVIGSSMQLLSIEHPHWLKSSLNSTCIVDVTIRTSAIMLMLLIFQGQFALFMEENSTSKCIVNTVKNMSF